ncbi:MAG: Scr1 family TA system antitoxin-like transcriptional regulator, partial [Saccharopolyspora rectivirgula]
VGPYAGCRGPFTTLEFFEEPDLVYLENHGTEMFLEEDADVSAYRRAFAQIQSVALTPEDSLCRIQQLVDERAGGAGITEIGA